MSRGGDVHNVVRHGRETCLCLHVSREVTEDMLAREGLQAGRQFRNTEDLGSESEYTTKSLALPVARKVPWKGLQSLRDSDTSKCLNGHIFRPRVNI